MDSPGRDFLKRLSLPLDFVKRHVKRESLDLSSVGNHEKQLQLTESNEVVEVSNDLDTFYSEDRIDSFTIHKLEGKAEGTAKEAHTIRRRFSKAGLGNGEGASASGATELKVKAEEKLGTLMGVFVPCLQNILGVILFIRLSWIVGQAGVLGSLGIVGMCCACTFLTSLSLSAIATNGHIKGGGPYYLIGRALGPELGVSVGICFYLGTAVAGAMYILGAVETILDMAPQLNIATESGATAIAKNDYRIYGFILLFFVVSVVFAGMKHLSRLAPAFLAPVLLSVFFILVGIWSSNSRNLEGDGISGISMANLKDNWSPEYYDTDANGFPGHSSKFKTGASTVPWSFQTLLALFFPSVTGIMAGSNRSASLENAQKSIPKGTLAAQLTTTTLYLSFVIWYGASAARDTLLDERLLSARISWPAPEIVSIGIILSTVGAALQSLTGAPRLLQAIANDRILPGLNFLATKNDDDEPTMCLLVTFLVTGAAISAGQLDVITPIITMFFLLCYAGVNSSCALLGMMQAPNWRPRWRYYHWFLSVIGLVLCFTIMCLISLPFTGVAVVLVIIIYYSVASRPDKGSKDWGDGLRSLKFNFAVQGMLSLDRMMNRVITAAAEWGSPISVHPMNWYPNPLILCRPWGLLKEEIPCHPKLIEFAKFLKPPAKRITLGSHGFTMIVSILEGDYSQRFSTAIAAQKKLWHHVHEESKFKGFCEVIVANSVMEGFRQLIQSGGLGALRPNMLVLRYPEKWRQLDKESMDSPGASEEAEGTADGASTKGIRKTSIAQQFQSIVSDAHTAGKAIVIIKGLDSLPCAGDQEEKVDSPASSTLSGGGAANGVEVSADEIKIDIQGEKGTIDTYWIVNDGGLMLLVSTLFRKHKVWGNCHLRVFCLATKEQNFQFLRKELEDLLYELRLNAEVIVLNINTEYKKCDRAEQQSIMDKAKKAEEDAVRIGKQTWSPGKQAALRNVQALSEETSSKLPSKLHSVNSADSSTRNRLKSRNDIKHSTSGIVQIPKIEAYNKKHYDDFVMLSLKLNATIKRYSRNAKLVMLSLPPPPPPPHSAYHYMQYIDLLVEDIPRVLLVRGYKQDVVTVFS
ncbi:family 12 solute carrier protein [Chloropicon primus]|uniref:Family 12 solute carrier protein n=1 Tax=Chloropicon primus TaxID=1764295 RepID=A0A5B8MLK8_9CHLO|nr:family 12 solute carrier protein [Chloropicon primus]UPQ99502.1 family 12 solute carrier protein [Chloropicon primus]|eukprot:QDZ20292.1 family 12 solute carrier protein [Chloropicon primus]